MDQDKQPLRLELCHDHFQRLLENATCETCPSKVGNAEACYALSALSGATDEDKFRGVLVEVHSARKQLTDLAMRVDRCEEYLRGDIGLVDRVTVIESKLSSCLRHVVIGITLSGILATTVIATVATLLFLFR